MSTRVMERPMRACPHCGANNEDENIYCNNCGASMPQLTRHVIQQVGPLAGIEGKKQETPTAKKDADAGPSPAIKKPKHRTMIGIGSVPPPPPTPGPVKLMQEGIKSKRHGTLIGMHVAADEMAIEQPVEQQAESDAAEQPIKPMVIKGVEAARPKEAYTPGMKAEGDKKAGLDMKSFVDDAEIEVLIEPAIYPEEDLDEEDVQPPEPEPRALERQTPAFREKKPPGRLLAPPAAMPPAAKEETGKTGYFVAAFLILAAVIGGYYYYQQAGHRQETARPSSSTEPEPAKMEAEQPQAQPEIAKWKVALQGIPENASVYVDDVLHPERPVTLKKTETPRKFKIEASGYETWEQSVAVESNVTLPIDMKMLSAVPPAAGTARQKGSKVAGEPSASKKLPKERVKEPPKKKPIHKKKGMYASDYNPYE